MNTRSIRFRLTVWYVGLLASLLFLFSASVYIGLGRYMKWTLEESLVKQAQQIGETLIANIKQSGEPYVIDEINEHFSPEINGRFVRVTRSDGSVLYTSSSPKDRSFDPGKIEVLLKTVNEANSRDQQLSDGAKLLIYTLPFTSRDSSRFLIETGAPYKQIDSVLHGLVLTLVLGFPLAIAVSIGGGYFFMRQALAPVDKITHSAEQITSRNLSERLPISNTGDELERLSISLNRMIARLEEAFQHTSRFSADASHELRTPLTVLRGELEAIIQHPNNPIETTEAISSALEETERLSKIVESLLAISRLEAGEAQMEYIRFDLSELTVTTVDQMRQLAEDKNISLECKVTNKVEVEGDRARLKQVVVNLLDNAIKYTPEGGSVQLTVSSNDSSAIIEVSDNGIGIPADALPHIFERFYRVDKVRSRQMGGAGLGLSIIKSICTAHGGQVEVKSIEGEGSRFRIELRLARETALDQQSKINSPYTSSMRSGGNV
jgi:heavy metal sensor kinase